MGRARRGLSSPLCFFVSFISFFGFSVTLLFAIAGAGSAAYPGLAEYRPPPRPADSPWVPPA
jgi:hypothetical protein